MRRAISRTLHSVRTWGQRLAGDEKGSVLTVLVAMPVLAGTVALGIETGQLYRVKRQMQSAADAAAVIGSTDRLASANLSTITADARYEAKRNGFDYQATGISVTVNSPPTSGPNMGTTGAVEVIVAKSQSFSLGALLINWLGGTSSSFTMRARSVAAQSTYTTYTTNNEGCIVALSTAAEQGVNLFSFNNLVSDCTIISNSTGTGANASVSLSNFNNATLNSIWTKGSLSLSSYNHVTYANANAPFTSQSSSITDPYSNLPTPTPGACNNFSQPAGNAVTLSPGTYCSGLQVTSVQNVYFTPGIYYVANGDLYLSSVNNVTCPTCTSDNGVAVVLTQTTGNNADIGGVKVSSDNNISLNAGKTNTGSYKGVLFYQDRRATTGTMSSTSKIFTVSSLNNATLSGAIYFPNNRIDIASINNFGGNSTTGCTVFVGRYIKFSSFNNIYKAGCDLYGTTPVTLTTNSTVTKARVLE
jgi:hypothetical protein